MKNPIFKILLNENVMRFYSFIAVKMKKEKDGTGLSFFWKGGIQHEGTKESDI